MSVYQKYFEENSGREFPIYGYSPPPDGQWRIDDTIYTTEDFRTVEKYKEYKDCGFNVLFLQHTAPYHGDGWENSETKLVMERAVEAGLDKIILVDTRIFDLSLIEGGLIGEGKKFASEAELDDFIGNCIKDYRHQKGFYGVQLRDEPFWPYLKTVGELFRSIARVDSGVFVHCNLNPLIVPGLAYQICPPLGKNMIECYENYLTMFLEESGADHIMMDTYPFYKSPDKAHIGRYYFAGLECVARICKKYGKEMHIVMQSFATNSLGKIYHRMPNELELQYQKNVLISFGVKQYSYFTYWTKQVNRTDGEFFPDGKAMMNRSGEKTRTYYHVQKINREITALAPLLWEFEYRANAFFVKTPFCTTPTYLEMARGGELSEITDVKTDKEIVLISELYDKKKKQYMYCAVNTTDIQRYKKKYKKEKQLTVLTFDKKYNVVDVYQNGKWQTVALENGKLEIKLYCSDGIIILPYKE
ncbi:MAG: hypothetical protein E7349_03275 [Clostridiales bacterium]|nr:hypothetical protein [Clostridiales bacterium]